jgi:uncharacterized protein
LNEISRNPTDARLLQLECGGRVVIPRVRDARGFFGRALGLMGRRALPEGMALRLAPCGAIHTFFMRFAIDVLFLARDGTILRFARGVRPWRWAVGARGAASVIEARAGWLDPAALPAGAQVRLTPVTPAGAAARAR